MDILNRLLRSHPDFFIIGAQKGGTTSLYRYLEQHPGVIPAKNKEINFFADNYERGFDWYWQRFPTRRACRRRERQIGRRPLTGEATPFYLFHPHVARRVHAAYPSARIIAMLRNPVDRAFSHHAYHVKLGVETLDFEAAIAVEPERLAGELARMQADERYAGYNYKMYSYLERGIYFTQLERWFQYFDRNQILIIRSEDFFADPRACFATVQEFLGLDRYELESYRAFNPGKESSALDPGTRSRLADHFDQYNQRLYSLLGRDFGWT